MPNSELFILQTIDHLYSEYSKMDKAARLGYLKGQWNRLNQMAYQYAAYLQSRVSLTQDEQEYAQRLFEMMNYVEAEGLKVENDLKNDVLKELMKAMGI